MTQAPAVQSNILERIGNTPMLELRRMDTGLCQMFVKLESENPASSVKDRMALTMIEAAEKNGDIEPGGTFIEATAGNTGLGLALVAAQKGYKLILVMPDKMSQDKIVHLRAMGAEVILTRSDVGKGHPEFFADMAERLARETPNSFFVDQFTNPANPAAHEATTGPEIWEQMEHKVDAVFAGVGSGGTITGLARFFNKHSPETKIFLADPEGSVLAEAVATGTPASEVGSWVVEGIGAGYVPLNMDLSVIDGAYVIPDTEALAVIRDLLLKEGILAGSSTGTLLGAALRYCHEQTEPKRAVTFVADTGNKYLSKIYNEYWLMDQGLFEREEKGNIYDLIARRHEDRGVVMVRPSDTLLTAYNQLKLYDVSQLPVLDEGGKLVGVVDENVIISHTKGSLDGFAKTVEETMRTDLAVFAPTAQLADVLPALEGGEVALIAEGDDFLGLISRIDVLTYLRGQLRKAES
jgi:cystathionine beta-synthase